MLTPIIASGDRKIKRGRRRLPPEAESCILEKTSEGMERIIMVREILLLGDPRLYEISAPVLKKELPALRGAIGDLFDTLADFKARHGLGRAIAAPQIGVRKRLIVMKIDTPYVFLNPTLTFPDGEMMEVLDDCMSFPGLFVRVLRHRRAVIRYRDERWNERELPLEGDLAELLQHEYDHLDGILATMRAIDNRSFVMRRG